MTICTALVSALSGTPVRRDVAMTGEITLRGRVLPIGGLREKTMAAYRAGVRTVVIPAENEPDLADIDPVVSGALRFVTAERIDTVLDAALVDRPRKQAPSRFQLCRPPRQSSRLERRIHRSRNKAHWKGTT